jgi:hypothetical protein
MPARERALRTGKAAPRGPTNAYASTDAHCGHLLCTTCMSHTAELAAEPRAGQPEVMPDGFGGAVHHGPHLFRGHYRKVMHFKFGREEGFSCASACNLQRATTSSTGS